MLVVDAIPSKLNSSLSVGNAPTAVTHYYLHWEEMILYITRVDCVYVNIDLLVDR